MKIRLVLDGAQHLELVAEIGSSDLRASRLERDNITAFLAGQVVNENGWPVVVMESLSAQIHPRILMAVRCVEIEFIGPVGTHAMANKLLSRCVSDRPDLRPRLEAHTEHTAATSGLVTYEVLRLFTQTWQGTAELFRKIMPPAAMV